MSARMCVRYAAAATIFSRREFLDRRLQVRGVDEMTGGTCCGTSSTGKVNV